MGNLKFCANFFLLVGAFCVSNLKADQIDGMYAKAYGNPQHQSILFLHGGPGYNSFSFEFSNADALAAKGYYVVVFDQRGSGRSDKAPIESYTFANAVKDVDTIATAYHLKNPILLGHSYGGTLGVKYAQAYPTKYKALILIDAPMDQQEMVANILNRCEEVYKLRQDAANVTNVQALRRSIFTPTGYAIDNFSGSELFVRAMDSRLYIPKESSLNRDAIWEVLNSLPDSSLVANTAHEPFEGFIRNERWMTGNELPSLQKIKAKTFGMFGADDGLFSAHQLKQIEAALQPGHFDLVIDASHNLFIDRQDEFLDFVDKVAASK